MNTPSSLPRSSVPLAVVPIRLPTTLVPCVESRVIPSEPFPEMTLREAAVSPPIVVPDARPNTASMRIPLFTLPRSLVPFLSVPT